MKNKLVIIIVGLLISAYAFAQDSLKLSLEEAQSYALEHNRSLKNASIEIQKAEASRWQTVSTLLPQINASLDYSNMLGYELDFGGASIAMVPYGTLGITSAVNLSAAQFIGIKLNDIATEMASITFDQTQQQISDQVKSIYFSTLVMEETIVLLEENLSNLEELLRHTERSVKVGVAEQTDADQISVQVVSMQTVINSTKRTLEMLYNSLRLQLGIDVNTDIKLTQTIDDLMNIEIAMNTLTKDFALDNNYNYKLLKKNTELSKKQVNMKKWDYAPSISVFHQYQGRKNFSDEPTFNMTPPNMIGVSLSVPIFSSLNRYAAVKEAKLSYSQQLNTLADTEESLQIQFRQLRYNLSSAFDNYETQKKNIEVTQRVFDNITLKYEQGLASSLDVTNSGTNLVSAQNDYVQSLMEVMSAQIELKQLLNY